MQYKIMMVEKLVGEFVHSKVRLVKTENNKLGILKSRSILGELFSEYLLYIRIDYDEIQVYSNICYASGIKWNPSW